MAYDTPGLWARLIRLPGQLLLALVNATALLVIVACILVIVVLNRFDAAGDRIAGTVTDAALSRLDVTPSDFKTRLEMLDARLETLSAQLSNADLKDHWALTQQLKELNQSLSDIRIAARGLGAAGPEVTEAAFRQAGDTLTDALFALRGCETGPKLSRPES